MSHERKKGGERKDKKNKRMHEAVEMRHELSDKQPHETDQKDVMTYKRGTGGDRNMDPTDRRQMGH
jgi:hypothetical protein